MCVCVCVCVLLVALFLPASASADNVFACREPSLIFLIAQYSAASQFAGPAHSQAFGQNALQRSLESTMFPFSWLSQDLGPFTFRHNALQLVLRSKKADTPHDLILLNHHV